MFSRIFHFYYDGFRNLPKWARNLWIIILIKLFIILVILKIFLMPDFLKKQFPDDKTRGDYIKEQLTK